MNLHHGHLYWPETYNNELAYSKLEENLSCDVLIVGGGMSGALCAYTLGKETDLDVVLMDMRQPGSGSSAAGSGILRYTSDRMLHELIEQKGEQDAVYFYQLSQQALEKITTILQELPEDAEFRTRKSLYLAKSDEDAGKLLMEYEALEKYGFPVEYLSEQEVSSRFPFSKPAALVTSSDADVNPYKLVHLLLKEANKSGVKIYGDTPLMQKTKTVHGFTCETENGTIQSRFIIFATGYENDFLVQQLGAQLHRSYAIATEPMAPFEQWKDEMIIRENNQPSLYLRTTKDGRIIAERVEEEKPETHTDYEAIAERAQLLAHDINAHFPQLDPKVSHAWYATFGESHDGLPYIGEHPNRLGEYYCLGFGSNGIVYSMLGAEILTDLITKGFHSAARLFTIARSASL
jgi:glycine/D-amino acid oxidase-like deaminating enzyme